MAIVMKTEILYIVVRKGHEVRRMRISLFLESTIVNRYHILYNIFYSEEVLKKNREEKIVKKINIILYCYIKCQHNKHIFKE